MQTTTRKSPKPHRPRRDRQILRDRLREAHKARQIRRSAKSVRSGGPVPVAAFLTAYGMEQQIADRFAGAISRKIGNPDATGTVRKRPADRNKDRAHVPGKRRKHGEIRTMRTFPVNLFAPSRIAAVLATYAPSNKKDTASRDAFDRLRLALAA